MLSAVHAANVHQLSSSSSFVVHDLHNCGTFKPQLSSCPPRGRAGPLCRAKNTGCIGRFMHGQPLQGTQIISRITPSLLAPAAQGHGSLGAAEAVSQVSTPCANTATRRSCHHRDRPLPPACCHCRAQYQPHAQTQLQGVEAIVEIIPSPRPGGHPAQGGGVRQSQVVAKVRDGVVVGVHLLAHVPGLPRRGVTVPAGPALTCSACNCMF